MPQHQLVVAPACFNSSLVRLEALKGAGQRFLSLRFNSSLVRLEGGRQTRRAARTDSFNSSLVRLEVVQLSPIKPLKGGFNSSLVRLEVIHHNLVIPKALKFQFQLGSIRSRPVAVHAGMGQAGFNSSLVRLEGGLWSEKAGNRLVSIPAWFD